MVLAFGWWRSRELVCHIDYLLLMRAMIARDASSSIDVTDLALSLLHPEHVFLWFEVCAFLSVVVCKPGRWLPTLALVLCWYYWAAEPFLRQIREETSKEDQKHLDTRGTRLKYWSIKYTVVISLSELMQYIRQMACTRHTYPHNYHIRRKAVTHSSQKTGQTSVHVQLYAYY